MSSFHIEQEHSAKAHLAGVRLISLLVILLFALSLIFWSVFARIDQAVAVTGEVTYGGGSLLLEHPTGGVVDEIFVKNGDRVSEGEKFLRLKDTGEAAAFKQIKTHMTDLYVREKYVVALSNGQTTLGDIQIPESFEIDQELLAELVVTYESQLPRDVRQGINAGSKSKARLKSARADLAGIEKQLNELNDKFDQQATVLDKSPAEADTTLLKAQLSELAKEITRFETQRQAAMSKVESIELQIEQAEFSAELQAESQAKTPSTSLTSEIVLAREKLEESKAAVDRLTIHAPMAGKVNIEQRIAAGTTITPWEPYGEIVPDSSEGIGVTLTVPAQDISKVNLDNSVKIEISSLGTRSPRNVEAEIVHIPASPVVDTQANANFFSVRANIESKAVGNVLNNIEILPGTPVEAYIVTGRKRVISYLLDPLLEQIRRPAPHGA